jgi:hypothetical protein
MRSFLTSVAAAVVLAVGAMYLLTDFFQRPADQAFTSPTNSVRIPDHGNIHNLVGKDWYSANEHGRGSDGVPTSNAAATLSD